MKKLLFGAMALALLAASPVQSNEGVTPMLKMDTTYYFQFFSPSIPAAPLPGRPASVWAFAWEGTLHGDINGIIRWWAEFPLSGVGRWELWDCEPAYPASDCQDPAQLIMAGYDTFGYVSATDWEGKGVVTYVNPGYPDFAEWFGRRITDGGYVDFADGVPIYGEGWFTIYNRPSNKH
jgi:hypothetical protein